MLAVVLTVLLAAPASTGEIPVEDTVIEPVEITPPPDPRASPEPGPDPGPDPCPAPIPGDRVIEPGIAGPALQPPRLPPPPPPPDGSGRLVGGSFAIGLGVGAAAAVAAEATREGGNPQFVASTFVPLGLISVGVGIYAIVRGVEARRNLRGWSDYTQARARPSGSGLLVAGVMSLVVGSVVLVGASVRSRDMDAVGDPRVPVLFGVGGAGVLTGAGTLAAGLVRRSRYRAWRQSTFLGVAPVPGGIGLGLTGEF